MKILLVFLLSVGLVAAAEAMRVNALTDFDVHYTAFHSDQAQALFDPFDYDVSHMTREQRAAFDSQRYDRQQASEVFARGDRYGTAQFLNEQR